MSTAPTQDQLLDIARSEAQNGKPIRQFEILDAKDGGGFETHIFGCGGGTAARRMTQTASAVLPNTSARGAGRSLSRRSLSPR